MPAQAQFPFHQVPVPAHVPATVDQRERGHFFTFLIPVLRSAGRRSKPRVTADGMPVGIGTCDRVAAPNSSRSWHWP